MNLSTSELCHFMVERLLNGKLSPLDLRQGMTQAYAKGYTDGRLAATHDRLKDTFGEEEAKQAALRG